MSPAAETRGVSSPGSLSLVAWEPLLSLRRSPCGRISLTEAWRSCHQEGGGGGLRTRGIPHTKSRGSRGSHRRR